MLKKILISVGVILLAAGLVVGGLLLWKHFQKPPVSDQPQPKTVLDFSKNYGACELFDKQTVKDALGTAAADLQDPQNMGIIGNKAFGEGVDDLVSDSQLCVYAFKTGGTLENGYNSGNALNVEKIVFTNEEGPKSLAAQIATAGLATEVEVDGERAFYSSNTAAEGPSATYTFDLELFDAKSSTKLSIRQPAETATFTAESAKEALTKLAELAKQDS